jgi:hypothetical protein
VKSVIVLGIALALGACAATPDGSAGANAAFERIKDSPPRLRAFLATMPKGSDLHIHLSGAVYAESNLEAGVKAGDCLNTTTQKISKPPCDAVTVVQPATKAACDQIKGNAPLSEIMKCPDLVARAIDGQSLRNFVPTPGLNGHDQFFNAFPKFGDSRNSGTMLAEELNRAGRQKVQHVEVMLTFGGGPVRELGASVPWTGSFPSQLAALEAKGLADQVPAARAEVASVVAAARATMACDGMAPQPGCAVSFRFLQQISRTSPPEQVAAQTAFGFMLAAAEPWVAGINIVAPEDSVVALRDYSLHMEMIGAMAQRYPGVGVALHAGELTMGLVPPEQLRSHIREAVGVGKARRIGHGVDVMYEDDPYGLLRLLAEKRVAVEINLTSNDAILGVRGAEHPFPVYLEEGVPTVLSTDDEGISRIDLTHEYQRAALEYRLRYQDLKGVSRRGLEYAFLPGPSLWADTTAWTMAEPCARADSRACAAFLATSDKARAQWALEDSFDRFEAEISR